MALSDDTIKDTGKRPKPFRSISGELLFSYLLKIVFRKKKEKVIR